MTALQAELLPCADRPWDWQTQAKSKLGCIESIRTHAQNRSEKDRSASRFAKISNLDHEGACLAIPKRPHDGRKVDA
jgi:hypothetical protein